MSKETVTSLVVFSVTAAAAVLDVRLLKKEGRGLAALVFDYLSDCWIHATVADPLTAKDSYWAVPQLLEKFPSLAQPLRSAPVLGLYFAAGWCDDCWKATPVLEKVCGLQGKKEKIIEIVYVSSDRSEQGMTDYKPKLFAEVPYKEVQERTRLKLHFGVCAKKEMADIGMTEERRRSGTPTLILIESATGRVLTVDGVEDFMKESPFSVLNTWRQMLLSDGASESWENLPTEPHIVDEKN